MTTPTNEIPLWQIKPELAKMWNEVTRSSVLTLVVYAPGAARAAQVIDRLNVLQGQHPSRAIILAVEPAEMRSEPAAVVSLQNHQLAEGASQVGDEQITIFLPDTNTDRISDFVTPLLLSDMPVFVWWAGNPPTNRHVIDDLVDLGDHQLFDSAAFPQPIRDIGILAHIIERCRSTAVNYKAFHDFTWARLLPWREALAQSFDPPYLTHLSHLTHLRLGFASDPNRPARPAPAYLLAGWLIARLGLTATSCTTRENGALAATLTAPQRPGAIALEIAPYTVPGVTLVTGNLEPTSQPSLLHGSLLFAEALTSVNGETITFRTMRTSDPTKGVSTITRGENDALEPLRWLSLETPSELDLLALQLTRFRYDHVYEDAVLGAQALLRAQHG